MRTLGTIVLGALMLLFGCLIASTGYHALRMWPFISAAFAAYGVLWAITGLAMLVGGLWALGCFGRSRVPFWIGGVGALFSGGSLIAGILTHVIPCSGPG